jgi:hypothetical protein
LLQWWNWRCAEDRRMERELAAQRAAIEAILAGATLH